MSASTIFRVSQKRSLIPGSGFYKVAKSERISLGSVFNFNAQRVKRIQTRGSASYESQQLKLTAKDTACVPNTFSFLQSQRKSSTPVVGDLIKSFFALQKRQYSKMATSTSESAETVAGKLENVTLHDILTPQRQATDRKNSPSQNTRRQKGLSNTKSPSKPVFPRMQFEKYWTKDRASSALQKGEVLEGTLRINARNFELAYVTPEDESGDILIKGLKLRNRALHGDKVVIELQPKEEWGKIQGADDNHTFVRTAKVVFISELKHSRTVAGFLKPFRNNTFGCALFSPLDSKVPRLYIPTADCPDGFEKRPQDFKSVLFIARMIDWRDMFALATGELVKSLGEAGEVETETEAFLLENGIVDEPFSSKALECLPVNIPWKVPIEEFKIRKDFRNSCIFTIDPPTARDLDDALSVRKLECGNFEVGVHIADVSYFVKEDTALDLAAQERATSVYLVQKVIPMLPRLLCEELCSLNPGVERLTFSVIWTMSPDGDVFSEWFGRSVIKSCTKLSYNHAQQMMENNVTELQQEQFPTIYGDHSLQKICTSVKALWGIAKNLRDKRFTNGALKLDQPKLSFTVDKESGLPSGCTAYEYKESNMMIEEFMLLANMAVAHKILKGNRKIAILRRHPKPDPKVLENLAKICEHQGIQFDHSDSKSLHDSLERVRQNPPVGLDEKGLLGIISLAAKSMKLAKYFCSGWFDNEELFSHYALNVPLYTHFTSPIRRYPDILVHRLLQASLHNDVLMNKSVQEMQSTAEHCNEKKLASKRVQEMSSELFFRTYVNECGPLLEEGLVIAVLDSALDVISSRFGAVTRIYCNALPLKEWKYTAENGNPQLKLQWLSRNTLSSDDVLSAEKLQSTKEETEVTQQVIHLLSNVKFLLKVDSADKRKLVSLLQHPELEL